MTQRKVTYRAELDGGARVKSEFRGIGQAGKDAHDTINTSSKSAAKSAEVFERRIRAEERSFCALKASVDPAYAAQVRYASAEAQVARAVQLGVVSKREAAQVLKQMQVQATTTSVAMQAVKRSTFEASGGFRQIGMQLSQVAQQGSITGNYLGAAAIQAADIGLAFGGVGIAVGALISVLGPMIFNVDKAKTKSKDLAKEMQSSYAATTTALDEAEQAQSRYNAAILLAKTNQDIVTPSVLAQLKLEAQARDAIARAEERKLNTERAALEQSIAAQQAIVDAEMARRTAQPDIAIGSAVELGNAYLIVEAMEHRKRIADEVNAAHAQIIQNIGDEQARLDVVNALLAQGYGEAAKTVDALLEAAKNADATATAVGTINFGSAISGAQELSRQLGVSLQRAMQIRGMVGASAQARRDTENPVLDPRDPRYDAQAARIAAIRQSMADLEYGNVSPFDVSRVPEVKIPKVKAGGRSGQSAAQKEQNRLMQEAARMTEANQTALERYNAEVERANMLREKGLISSDTHNRELVRLKENLDKATEAQRQLMGIAQPVKDALVNSLMGQKNAADQLREALKRAAIEYALFGTGGFARKGSGFKGLLGNVFSSIFSFDGGGYTPPGPRSGGLDGKGGFWAVMHPNERVDDLTKPGAGRGGGGRVEVAVGIDGNGSLIPVIKHVAGNVTAQMLGAGMQSMQQGFGGQLDSLNARGTS